MASASDKFKALLPSQLGVGPHAVRLVQEAQMAARHNLWVSVIILSATIVDVMRHEDEIFDLSDLQEEEAGYDYDQAGYFEAGGYDYLNAAERKKLEWLRSTRNQLVHYEGPVEGMLGRPSDEGTLAQMADKALSALLIILEKD